MSVSSQKDNKALLKRLDHNRNLEANTALDNMHILVPLSTVGNGLWEKGEMGNRVRMASFASRLWG